MVLPEQHKDGFQFAEAIYQSEKVAVVPGIHFSPTAERFIRINIARTTEELQEGLDRLRDFMNKS